MFMWCTGYSPHEFTSTIIIIINVNYYYKPNMVRWFILYNKTLIMSFTLPSATNPPNKSLLIPPDSCAGQHWSVCHPLQMSFCQVKARFPWFLPWINNTAGWTTPPGVTHSDNASSNFQLDSNTLMDSSMTVCVWGDREQWQCHGWTWPDQLEGTGGSNKAWINPSCLCPLLPFTAC